MQVYFSCSLLSGVIASVFLCASVHAQDFERPDQQGRLGNWLMTDTYWPDSNGCDATLGDHVTPSVNPGCGIDGGVSWRLYQGVSGTPDWLSPCSSGGCNAGRASVDFNCAYENRASGAPDNGSAYALTYLVVETSMTVVLVSAGDDTYRYWIDDTLVFSSGANCQCYSDGQNTRPVFLEAGVHRLLVQVSERGGHWGFVMRVLDDGGAPITDGRIRATTTPNACPPAGYSCEDNSPCTVENAAQGQFYFPAAAGPEYFIQCSEWQQCYQMLCPAGLVWDQTILTCNYP